MSQLQEGHLGIFTACQTLHIQLLGWWLVGLLLEVPKLERKTRKCFLLTWAFQFPALQLTKDHNNTTRASKLMPLFGTDTWKTGSFPPQWSLLLDFLFSGPTYPCWRLSRTFLMDFLPSLGQTPDCRQHMQGFCPQQLQTSPIPSHSNVVKTILEWVLLHNFTKHCMTKSNCF